MNGSFIIPLAKVDVEKRLVIGRAVQEMVDKSGEILDYASARPAFEAWSKEMSDASGGLSKGNLRVMHSKTVAGKLVDITYNDDEKAIDVVAKVVDDNEWRKVLEGCYTGFSVGGAYAKKWKVGTNTHYTPKVSELSLVDMPCIPSAKFFELHKADGAVEKIEFKTVAVVDHDDTPEPGDTIEFSDDAFVEAGPCNCKVGAVDEDHLALDMGEDSNPDIVDWSDVRADGVAMAAPRETGTPRRWFVARKTADKSVEPELLMKRAKVDRAKVAAVMAEFKAGTLKSGDGSTVTDRKQAMAIALSEARLGKAERKRKGKGKDGRAGRDGDGDGKLNESGDGGAGGSPPAAAAPPPAPTQVEVVGQVDPKRGVIRETRFEPGASYAGAAAGAVGGAMIGRFVASRNGLRRWQNWRGDLPDRLGAAAGRTMGVLTAKTYNAVTPKVINLGHGGVKSVAAAAERVGRGAGAAVSGAGRFVSRRLFHGIYSAAGGPKRTKRIGAAIGAAYLGYEGFRAGRLIGSEIDRWKAREVDLTRAWAPLDLSKAFDESKVKRDERGRFASMGGVAAGVAAGAAVGAGIGYAFGRGKNKTAAAAAEVKGAGKVTGKPVARQLADYISKNVMTPLKRQALAWGKEGVKGFKNLPFGTKLKIALGLAGGGAAILRDVANLGYEYRSKNYGFEVDLVIRDDAGKVKSKLWSYNSTTGKEIQFSFGKDDEDAGGGAPGASDPKSSSSDSSFESFMPGEGRSQVRAQSMANAARAIVQRSDSGPKQVASIVLAARNDDKIDIHDKNDVYRAASGGRITQPAGTSEAEAQVASVIRDWNSGGAFSRNTPNADRFKRAAHVLINAFARDKGWLQSNVDKASVTTEIHPWVAKDAHAKVRGSDDGVDNRKGRDGDGDGKKNENDKAENEIKAALKERNTLAIPGEPAKPRLEPRARHERETEDQYEDYVRGFYVRAATYLPKSVMTLDLMKAFDESKIKRGSNGKFASKSGMISSGTGYAGGSLAWHAVGDRISRGFASTWPGKIVSTGAKIGASVAGSNIGERGGRVIESTLGIKQRKMGRFEDYGRIAGGLVGGIAGGLGLGVAGAIAGSVVPGAGTIAGGLAARVAGDTAGSMVGEAAGGWIGRYLDGRNTPAAAPAAAGRFAPPKQRAPRAPRAPKGPVAPRAPRSSGAARAQPTVTT